MVELLRSNDLVYLSWVEATLKAEGIFCIIMDQHTSNIEGSIGAIQRRVMLADDDLSHAKAIIDEGPLTIHDRDD